WITPLKTSYGGIWGLKKDYFTIKSSSNVEVWDLIILRDLFPQRVPSKIYFPSSVFTWVFIKYESDVMN
ncbi:hypothetical protein, partial [Klebsiella pneumoniae]|uniref:hypothetical protein n=1 Tax=Klebsiella pneumoniae TaxID=573 RepID=UPI003A807C14